MKYKKTFYLEVVVEAKDEVNANYLFEDVDFGSLDVEKRCNGIEEWEVSGGEGLRYQKPNEEIWHDV